VKYFLTITLSLLTLLPLFGQGSSSPYAEASLTSRHLIPGEQTNLIISLRGAQPDHRPAAPVVANTAINFVRAITQLDTQRRLTQVFLYRLTPAKAGKYTIPPVVMTTGGKQYQSPSVTFEVHDTSQLIPLPTGISGHQLLAGWFPSKTTLYQGEQCPVTLKLYAPEVLRLVSWGLPDPIKENCLAWRFSLPALNELGRVSINGVSHLSAKYETTLSGISAGTAIFGPSKLRIIVRQQVIDPRFGPRISDTPVELTLPASNFDILPFPEAAPSDFLGAVGDFQIRAQCSKLTLNDTDSTEVTLQVGGTGNLENIKAPVLTGDAWKIIDTSKITRGKERRYVSGVVTFRQLIRPAKRTPLSIPPYSFSYFDPNDKSFHTLTTPAIPVSVIAAPKGTAAAAAATTGIEEKSGTPPDGMRDILGFIDKPAVHHSPFTIHYSLFYHLVPASIALLIIAIPIGRKIKSARIKSPDHQRKQDALAKLATSTDTRIFYRRAGRFIDQWLTPNDELKAILAERDEVCFLPDDVEVDNVPDERKKEIINLLKRCSKLALILLLFFTTQFPTILNAQDKDSTFTIPHSQFDSPRDAWKAGQYQQVIDLYQQDYPTVLETPADVLYNIGTCHHRLDQFGHAALAWRRALAVAPDHHKARQNLRYLEIKEGSYRPKFDSWQNYLTVTTPNVYRSIFYTSLWIFLIILLVLIFLRPRRKVLLVTPLFFLPIATTLGGLGVYYFPDSDFHTPFSEQAVNLKKSSLYKEAHRLEKDPERLPVASYIHIIAERGPWTHVETSDGLSGWVPSEDIGIVLPSR